MKKEEQVLYKIMRHFEGMQKIEVFDLLHKMEVVLFYAKSPLTIARLKQIISADAEYPKEIDPFQFTILPNGNFCEFIEANHWIHIYKEIQRGIHRWNPIATYYFKTRYAPLELLKLTKKNLMENVYNTPHERLVANFLRKHTAAKKCKITGRLLLIDL